MTNEWDFSRRSSLLDRLALLAALALLVVLIGVHEHVYTKLSPIDELQHIDYVDKATSLHIVRRGEHVGQAAMSEEACRGVDAPGFEAPTCGQETYYPAEFQEGGLNTASVHTPVYYAITGWIASAARAVGITHSLVTSARLVGILWLGAAVALLWRLLVAAAARPITQFSLIALLVSSPLVLHATATVNPDAGGLLAGVLLLTAVLRWEHGRCPLVVPVAASVFVILLKFTNIAVIGLVLIYLLGRAYQRHQPAVLALGGGADLRARFTDPELRRVLRLAVVIVVAALGTWLLWSIVQSMVALVAANEIPMNEGLKANHFPTYELVREMRSELTPFNNPYLPPFLRVASITAMISLVDLGSLIVMGGAAFVRPVGSATRSLAVACFGAMITLGPVIAISTYVSNGVIIPTPARYGLPILPALLLVAIPLVDRHAVTRWLVALGAAVSVALVLTRFAAA
jgi:hypothetical protein